MPKSHTSDPDELVGRAIHVSELLEYQKGAIVSKSLVSSKKGTVVVVAVDKDQSMEEHTARSHASVFLIEGEADVELRGETHRLKKGDLIVLPAGEPHAVRAVKRFKMLLSLVRI